MESGESKDGGCNEGHEDDDTDDDDLGWGQKEGQRPLWTNHEILASVIIIILIIIINIIIIIIQ